MTDAELVRLCAIHVYGEQDAFIGRDPWGDEVVYWGPYRGAFNPLTSDADSCAVLDKMVADGFDYTIQQAYRLEGVTVTFQENHQSRPDAHYWQLIQVTVCVPKDRKRAIVLAALKAKGVEIG